MIDSRLSLYLFLVVENQKLTFLQCRNHLRSSNFLETKVRTLDELT